jgi:hypothetical protein
MGRLKSSMNQSSHQTKAGMKRSSGVEARPHPGPLPRGEGEPSTVTGQFVRPITYHRRSDQCFKVRPRTKRHRFARERRIILPAHEPVGLWRRLAICCVASWQPAGHPEPLLHLPIANWRNSRLPVGATGQPRFGGATRVQTPGRSLLGVRASVTTNLSPSRTADHESRA